MRLNWYKLPIDYYAHYVYNSVYRKELNMQKIYDEPMKPRNIMLPDEQTDWLKRQPNGMSATIRALIANAMAVDNFIERRVRNDSHYQGRDRRSA